MRVLATLLLLGVCSNWVSVWGALKFCSIECENSSECSAMCDEVVPYCFCDENRESQCWCVDSEADGDDGDDDDNDNDCDKYHRCIRELDECLAVPQCSILVMTYGQGQTFSADPVALNLAFNYLLCTHVACPLDIDDSDESDDPTETVCVDVVGWTDLAGNECDIYESNQWCNHELNNMLVGRYGLDADVACCACGGGDISDISEESPGGPFGGDNCVCECTGQDNICTLFLHNLDHCVAEPSCKLICACGRDRSDSSTSDHDESVRINRRESDNSDRDETDGTVRDESDKGGNHKEDDNSGSDESGGSDRDSDEHGRSGRGGSRDDDFEGSGNGESDGCGSDEWDCDNGDCIPAVYECDNYVDCSDGTDEDPHCNAASSTPASPVDTDIDTGADADPDTDADTVDTDVEIDNETDVDTDTDEHRSRRSEGVQCIDARGGCQCTSELNLSRTECGNLRTENGRRCALAEVRLL